MFHWELSSWVLISALVLAVGAPGFAIAQTTLPAPISRLLLARGLPEAAVSAFVQRIGTTEPPPRGRRPGEPRSVEGNRGARAEETHTRL